MSKENNTTLPSSNNATISNTTSQPGYISQIFYNSSQNYTVVPLKQSNHSTSSRRQERYKLNQRDPETGRKKKNNPVVESDGLGEALQYLGSYFNKITKTLNSIWYNIPPFTLPGAKAMPIHNLDQEEIRQDVMKNLRDLESTSSSDCNLVSTFRTEGGRFIIFKNHETARKMQASTYLGNNCYVGEKVYGLVGNHDTQSLRQALLDIKSEGKLYKKIYVRPQEGKTEHDAHKFYEHIVGAFLELARSSEKNRKMVDKCIDSIGYIIGDFKQTGLFYGNYEHDKLAPSKGRPTIFVPSHVNTEILKQTCHSILNPEEKLPGIPVNSVRLDSKIGQFVSVEKQRGDNASKGQRLL